MSKQIKLSSSKYFIFDNLIYSKQNNTFFCKEDIPLFYRILFSFNHKILELFIDNYFKKNRKSKISIINQLNSEAKFGVNINLKNNISIIETKLKKIVFINNHLRLLLIKHF